MQKQSEHILIERLRETVGASRNTTEEAWVQAEMQLGFALPAFLKRVYLEVGNGGFGPGYGLFPLNNHSLSSQSGSLVTTYFEMRSMSQQDIDKHWADAEEKPALWPEQVLMICDWGCNIYSCLNCSSPDLPIFRMDNNVNFMVEWAIEASSLQQWLEAWVDRKPLFHLNWEQAVKVSVSHLGKIF